MKKVLTAMTAMSLTLQASEEANQILDVDETSNQKYSPQINTLDSNLKDLYTMSEEDQNSVKGSSGSFHCAGVSGSFGGTGGFATSGVFFCEKVVLGFDADNSGSISSGDTLYHSIKLNNATSSTISGSFGKASGSFIDAAIDNNLSLNVGSVTTTKGYIYSGNSNNNSFVGVVTGDISPSQTVDIHFTTTVTATPDDGLIIKVPNQALFTSVLGQQLSDDVTTLFSYQDPTFIYIHGLAVNSYDDNQEPDFTEHYEIPTPVLFPNEFMRVTGTVGGIGYDLEDCFQFQVSPDKRLKKVILENYQATSNNPNTEFHMFYGLPSPKSGQGDILQTRINAGDYNRTLLNRTFSYGQTLSACLYEAIPGQSYSLLFEFEITDLIFRNGLDIQPQ